MAKKTATPKPPFRAISDWLVIEKGALPKQIGSIIMPDEVNNEDMPQGTVVAAGPGRLGDDGKRLPMEVKVGDHVHVYTLKKTVGIRGKQYLIARNDTVAVVESQGA